MHPQKFVGNTELRGVFDRSGGCAATRRDLDGLERGAEREPHEAQQRVVQSPALGDE